MSMVFITSLLLSVNKDECLCIFWQFAGLFFLPLDSRVHLSVLEFVRSNLFRFPVHNIALKVAPPVGGVGQWFFVVVVFLLFP